MGSYRDNTLVSMIQKGQQFDDAKQSSKSKKSLRRARQDGGMGKLRSEIDDLKRQGLQRSKPRMPDKKIKLQCCNCHGRGYFSRDCPEDRLGMSFLTDPKGRPSQLPMARLYRQLLSC